MHQVVVREKSVGKKVDKWLARLEKEKKEREDPKLREERWESFVDNDLNRAHLIIFEIYLAYLKEMFPEKAYIYNMVYFKEKLIDFIGIPNKFGVSDYLHLFLHDYGKEIDRLVRGNKLSIKSFDFGNYSYDDMNLAAVIEHGEGNFFFAKLLWLENIKKCENRSHLGSIYSSIAECDLKLGNDYSAMKYLKMSYIFGKNFDPYYRSAQTLVLMAKIYFRKGNLHLFLQYCESALKQKNFVEEDYHEVKRFLAFAPEGFDIKELQKKEIINKLVNISFLLNKRKMAID